MSDLNRKRILTFEDHTGSVDVTIGEIARAHNPKWTVRIGDTEWARVMGESLAARVAEIVAFDHLRSRAAIAEMMTDDRKRT